MGCAKEIELLFELYKSGKRIESVVRKHNSDALSMLMILTFVSEKACPISEIAQLASIRLSAATTKVKAMEKEGFLKRVTFSDKRSHCVLCTKKGHMYIKNVTAQMKKKVVHLDLGLRPLELTRLVGLLKKITWEGLYEKKHA